ncbi:MAG: sigma 54-interacting transcriptional regulator [Pirellulales bacterium]|nr:sigma 54-interacting transcriptional regulator [Pirellulales bacterium]
MTRSPIKPMQLRRLFDELPEPCFAVDDRGRIAWCNRACADLFGLAPDALVGIACRYDASGSASVVEQANSPRSPEAIGVLLCPPPDVPEQGVVVRRLPLARPGGEVAACRATFLALGRSAWSAGRWESQAAGEIVVFGWLTALPTAAADESATLIPLAAVLHDQLLQLRTARAVSQAAIELGPSRWAARLRAQLAAAARCEAPVAFVGPEGSGRTQLAAALHAARFPTVDAQRLTIDCARMPAEQIRAALAQLITAGRRGRSLRGTLLLADVEHLPAEIQAELEHVLDDERLGLCPVVTSAKALEELADSGQFRAALAMTLATLSIVVVPLSRRREDIPLLAQQALEARNEPGGKQLAGLVPAAMERLIAYDWPGQWRELDAAMAHAHDQAAGTWVQPGDLPEQLRTGAAQPKSMRQEQPLALDAFLVEVETELLRRAMARAKGNKAKAARLLGMTRPRLYRRLVQLGLESPSDESGPGE